MRNGYLSLLLLLTSLFVSPLFAKDQTATFDWCEISAPEVFDPSAKIVEVQVNIKGQALKSDMILRIDRHFFIGKKRVPKGGTKYKIEAGESKVFTNKIKVPEGADISGLEIVVYASPTGGWKDKIHHAHLTIKNDSKKSNKKAAVVKKNQKEDHFTLTLSSPALPMVQPSVVQLTETRGEMVLNGPWKFCPKTESEPRSEDWGQIWVPGSWKPSLLLPGLIQAKKTSAWEQASSDMSSAWYERRLLIPAHWEGRRITLDFDKISTGAVVSVNSKACGAVDWPFGEVDITNAVAFGQENQVRILVQADELKGEELVKMGGAKADYKRKLVLENKGIIGDLVLYAKCPRKNKTIF